MSDVKLCKYCKSEIPKGAKVCPVCYKKQKKPLGIIIAVIVVLAILVGIFGGGNDEQSQVENSASTDKEVVEKDNIIKVGDSFEAKGLSVTVNNAEVDHKVSDPYGLYKLDDGLVYLMVDFTFENTGDGDKYVSIYDFKCYADDAACEQEFVTADTGDFINTNLSSGRKCSFKTLYAVPANATTIELEYDASIWTDEKVKIQIK